MPEGFAPWHASEPLHYRAQEWDATSKVAKACVKLISGRRLTSDELKVAALPALGISRREGYTFTQQANALGEHLAYGFTTDLICRKLLPDLAETE